MIVTTLFLLMGTPCRSGFYGSTCGPEVPAFRSAWSNAALGSLVLLTGAALLNGIQRSPLRSMLRRSLMVGAVAFGLIGASWYFLTSYAGGFFIPTESWAWVFVVAAVAAGAAGAAAIAGIARSFRSVIGKLRRQAGRGRDT